MSVPTFKIHHKSHTMGQVEFHFGSPQRAREEVQRRFFGVEGGVYIPFPRLISKSRLNQTEITNPKRNTDFPRRENAKATAHNEVYHRGILMVMTTITPLHNFHHRRKTSLHINPDTAYFQMPRTSPAPHDQGTIAFLIPTREYVEKSTEPYTSAEKPLYNPLPFRLSTTSTSTSRRPMRKLNGR